MKREARVLFKMVPHIDMMATSPLVRAIETGEIVAGKYEGLKPAQISPLSPGKTPMALLNWVQKHPGNSTLALVGHEPSLGIFISWLLTGLQESFVVLKKGRACLLELNDEIKPGRAKLIWFLKPSQLQSRKRQATSARLSRAASSRKLCSASSIQTVRAVWYLPSSIGTLIPAILTSIPVSLPSEDRDEPS